MIGRLNLIFIPDKDHKRESKFIQKFTSVHLKHYHYLNGKRND